MTSGVPGMAKELGFSSAIALLPVYMLPVMAQLLTILWVFLEGACR